MAEDPGRIHLEGDRAEVRLNLKVPKALAASLSAAAEKRLVGVSLLAARLLEYGLDNLLDPVLWRGSDD